MTGALIGLTALAALLWLAGGIRRIGAVSKGEVIGDRPGTALLMIDLQSVFWDHGSYDEAAKAAAGAQILREVEAARAQGHPVIAVRQEWSIPSTKAIARLAMKGQAIAGTPGTEIAAPFEGLSDHVIVKRVQDAFETGALDALLARLKVGRLRMVGLDFNHCVAKTALAARQRGHVVEVVTGATLAAVAVTKTSDRLAAAGVRLV